MIMSSITIFIALLAIQLLGINADDPCRFETSKGVIDLSTLARDDGKPAYQDQVPPAGSSSYKYSYNPCRPFSEGSFCQNVAACQVSTDGRFTYSLGTQDSATWNDGTSFGLDPTVSYIYNQKITRVTLECVSNGTQLFEALGETAINTFAFRLRHKCACWNGCTDTPDNTTTTTTKSSSSTSERKNTTTTAKSSSPTTRSPSTESTTMDSTTSTTPVSTGGDGIIIGRRTVLMTTLLLFVYSKVFTDY